MIQIFIANKEEQPQILRELFQEYLVSGNTKLFEEVEATMQHLDWFMPSKGRLLLGYMEDQPIGIACLKPLTDSIARSSGCMSVWRPEIEG